jgi:cell division protein FtsB
MREIDEAYLNELARDEAFNMLFSAARALLAERDQLRTNVAAQRRRATGLQAELDEAHATNRFLRQTNQDIADERVAHEALLERARDLLDQVGGEDITLASSAIVLALEIKEVLDA